MVGSLGVGAVIFRLIAKRRLPCDLRYQRVTAGALRRAGFARLAWHGRGLPPPRTAQVLLRGEPACHQVLVRHLPDRTRRLAPVPASRAGGAVAALVGF